MFLDEHKNMSQNIIHQPQIAKAPSELKRETSSMDNHILNRAQLVQKQNNNKTLQISPRKEQNRNVK